MRGEPKTKSKSFKKRLIAVSQEGWFLALVVMGFSFFFTELAELFWSLSELAGGSIGLGAVLACMVYVSLHRKEMPLNLKLSASGYFVLFSMALFLILPIKDGFFDDSYSIPEALKAVLHPYYWISTFAFTLIYAIAMILVFHFLGRGVVKAYRRAF